MSGRVTLLGAGPGDPELLTVLGKRRLANADVVLFDRLVNPSLLAETKDKATLVDVGKMPKFHKVRQAQINQLLVDYARQGLQIVRLKAGDPYVFGRGGEEAQVLAAQGVDFEVIPGITSAIAGLAAAGIPITHRDFASSFHVITGHHKQNGRSLDWENIAHQEGTLVFLMGMAELETITGQLMRHGKEPTTPVAIIQWAIQWRQKVAVGALETISELVKKQGLGSPALIVVGGVVSLHKDLVPHGSLQGRHYLVPESKRASLFHQLQDRGATVDLYPRARLVVSSIPLPKLDQFKTILVDTLPAFRFFQVKLLATGKDLRELAGYQVIVANSLIGKHLRAMGVVADQVGIPEDDPSVLEIGSETPRLKQSTFIATYHREREKNKPFPDLDDVDGMVIPSKDALADFVSAYGAGQKEQLESIPAYAMGEQVTQVARRLFNRVIECPPSIPETITAIEQEVGTK